MTVKYDWPISFDRDQFLEVTGETYTRLLRRPGMVQVFDEMVAEATNLVHPAAVWEAHPIQELRHEKVILQNGKRIGNGPVTTVVAGASHLVVAVCTIGQPMSDRATEYQKTGEPLRALFLDGLGTFAVGMLRQRVCDWLENDCASQGLHSSTSLSPGESIWTIKDQTVIFDLVDAGAIGVTLTETLLMKPFKSLSLIMGIGNQPMGVPGTTHCDYCTMADRCPHRQVGAASAVA